MKSNELKETIIKMYQDAFLQGTDEAWKQYKSKLAKLAKENDARSPEALEEWALTIF